MTTTIEIRRHENNPVCADVFINGQQIYGIRSVKYEHRTKELPTLELDLGGVELEGILMNLNVDELVKLKIK